MITGNAIDKVKWPNQKSWSDQILRSSSADELRARIKSYLANQSFNLPLWQLCQDGGRPEVINISVDHVTRTDNSVSATASVEFAEVVPASCGVSRNRNKSCTLRVEIEGQEVRVAVEEEMWDGQERGAMVKRIEIAGKLKSGWIDGR